jgi:predicted metalloendopeptidase
LRTILEGTYEDAYKDLLSTDEGFHREEEAAIDKENFDTMQSYYNLCLDSQRIDSLGPTPIYENIANIENVLFPVKDAEEVFTSNATPALSKVLAFFSKNGIGSLNSIYIDADDKNPSMNAILFDQVSLGLPSKEYYEDADTLKKYQAGLNDVLYKVLGDYSNGTEDAAFRAKESQRNSFTLWSKEKIAAAVDRYIAFETQLANISIKK